MDGWGGGGERKEVVVVVSTDGRSGEESKTLSQAINQRHSYCGTIIQSSLLHNSSLRFQWARCLVSIHPGLEGQGKSRRGRWSWEGKKREGRH